jgi:hypothetical protein
MSAQASYRFLPWTRRGMAAGIVAADSAAASARAIVSVGITVSGAGDSAAQLKLYGPGDVVGIDPRLIVRMEPRPNATDVEPNYLAALEFDPPDFAWMFTPAAAAAGERLRPWCVLVVIDNAVVAPPHLERGVPLPVIEVPSAAVLTELPDLAESWAWAHTQVLTGENSPAALRAELRAAPHRQLSRLLCPRRLEPDRRYSACLVPAFAVGALRGLGGTPAEDAVLAPAWTLTGGMNVRLPVYYHWEFATGPKGDFESLARALQPYRCDAAEVGVEPMFVGDAGAGLPTLDPADPAATMGQDGALRAPLATSGTLADVPPVLADGLRTVLNAPAAQLAGEPEAGTPTLAPPLYGEWHVDRHRLADDAPAWFRELNLDPRARVAASLGAEVVRAHQEAFMEVCWDQVGKVLDANEALNRARLALEAARRVHERHFQPLPADVLTQVASGLHRRVRQGAGTLRSAIHQSSLPDATTDAAMRRLTSGQRPVLKKLARLRGDALPPSRAARPQLARSLAAGREDVDPGRFVPGGLLQLDFLSAAGGAAPGSDVDLTPFGVPMRLSGDQMALLTRRFADLAAAPTRTAPTIGIRTNIQATGVVTTGQLTDIAAVSTATPTTIVDRRALLSDLLVASVEKPGAVAYLVTVGNRSGQTLLDALDVSTGGEVMIRPTTGRVAVPIATMPAPMTRASSAELGRALSALPSNSLDRRGRVALETAPTSIGDVGSIRPVAQPAPIGSRNAGTVSPPTRDAGVLSRFDTTFRAASSALQLSATQASPTLVQFDLATAGSTILMQTDPRRTIPLRTAARIHVGGQRLDQTQRPGVRVAPTFDRIMVAPSIATPLYEQLAEYDRTRLLPGVDHIPDDGITLLETNARFVQAFLAGANHEMNRELLWRRYPTDQRGTPLQRFWDWLDDGVDVPPIHTWNPAGALGTHTRGSASGQLVLLVRGRLLRRYPNSVIYAWRAAGGRLIDPPQATDLRNPMFGGQFAPDITYVGFDLTFEEITQGEGWFFVIQQQPTEPRFGFDELPPEAPAVPASWSDATWSDAEVAPGRHLTLAGSSLAGSVRRGAVFGRDAAHMAAVMLQKPMRVALHGSQLAVLR